MPSHTVTTVDLLHHSRSWFRKGNSKGPQVAVNASEVPRPSSSGSVIRNVFTGWKHHTKHTPGSSSRNLASEAISEDTELPAQSSTLAYNDHHRLRTGPEYASTTQPPPKPIQQTTSNSTNPKTAVTTASPPKGKLSRKASRLDILRAWKKDPIDLLADVREDIQVTTNMIESKTWCPRIKQKPSSLSLGELVAHDKISPDTRELFQGGLKEFQEWKKEEEAKQKREEEERKEGTKMEETFEVAESKTVRYRCERLAPVQPDMKPRRPLDLRAQFLVPAAPFAEGTSLHEEGSVSSSGATMPIGRLHIRRSIMDRTRAAFFAEQVPEMGDVKKWDSAQTSVRDSQDT